MDPVALTSAVVEAVVIGIVIAAGSAVAAIFMFRIEQKNRNQSVDHKLTEIEATISRSMVGVSRDILAVDKHVRREVTDQFSRDNIRFDKVEAAIVQLQRNEDASRAELIALKTSVGYIQKGIGSIESKLDLLSHKQ